MRTWFYLFSLCLLFSTLLRPQPLSAQTIDNAGFEGSYSPQQIDPSCPGIQGEIAPGWIDNTCWESDTAITYGRETEEPRSGSAAQRIELHQGRVQFAQWLQLQNAKRYTVQIWLRAAAPMAVELLLRQADTPYSTYASQQLTLTTTWTQYTLTGLAQAEAGFLMLLTTTPGIFWVDDVALQSESWRTNLPDSAIPRSFFGMHIHRTTTPWPAVQRRIGAIRLWDADGPPGAAQWAAINPSPDVYEWTALDAHVERALANNASLVMNLGRTPQWASARPTEPSPYGPGQAAEPANDLDWQAWVRAVGERYRGRIRYWEIWNEPNDRQFYSGTPEKLVELASQAYALLKTIDPANQIVSPSAYAIDYLDRYLTLGGGEYADIIGYHFYISEAPELLYNTYIPNVRVVLAKHGLSHKPLWNTEEGWLRATPFAPLTLSDEVGAGYVARAYILNWAAGVDRYFYYAWDNDGYIDIELTRSDHTTLTQSGLAYREVAGWLIGNQMVDLQHSADDRWQVQLIRPDGQNSYLLWNPTQPVSFTVPTEWQIRRQRNLDGTMHDLSAGTAITLTATPLLLEAAIKEESSAFLPLVTDKGRQR